LTLPIKRVSPEARSPEGLRCDRGSLATRAVTPAEDRCGWRAARGPGWRGRPPPRKTPWPSRKRAADETDDDSTPHRGENGADDVALAGSERNAEPDLARPLRNGVPARPASPMTESRMATVPSIPITASAAEARRISRSNVSVTTCTAGCSRGSRPRAVSWRRRMKSRGEPDTRSSTAESGTSVLDGGR